MESLEFTLTKSVTFNLKPFGHFKLKWIGSKKDRFEKDVLLSQELYIDNSSRMPYGDKYNLLVQLMKDNKTNILTDGTDYYTILRDDLVIIKHEKLSEYQRLVNLVKEY